MAAKDGFRTVKLQRPIRATVCSHSSVGHGRHVERRSYSYQSDPKSSIDWLLHRRTVVRLIRAGQADRQRPVVSYLIGTLHRGFN